MISAGHHALPGNRVRSRVLIAECALTDPPEMESHLSPRGLAEMADVVGPELLIVTHVYPPQTPAQAVERVRERYAGRTVAAVDGLRVRIAEADVTVDPPGSAV